MSQEHEFATLYGLLNELGEVESDLARRTEEREHIRDQIGKERMRLGRDVELPGLATVRYREPRTQVRYDWFQVEGVISHLAETGDLESATALAQARKESPVKGGVEVRFATNAHPKRRTETGGY